MNLQQGLRSERIQHMPIDPHSTVQELLAEHPVAFDVLAGHGMCEDCKANPPQVPLEHFAQKHCGGNLSGLIAEIEKALELHESSSQTERS